MEVPLIFTDRAGNAAMLPPALCPELDGGALVKAAGEAGLHDHSLFATSGVSGVRRFACLSNEAMLASARAVNAHYNVTPTDRWICCLPVFHVGGISISLRASLSGAGHVTLDWREWSAERFLSECQDHHVTLAPLVPTQLYDLVEAGAVVPPTLRAAIIGGGALDPGLRAKAEGLGWPVRETYGMTEAASQVAAEPEGAGGRMEVLPHWEARVDAESRLWLRGPALFSGYLVPGSDGHWELERPFDIDGWFRTEDRVDLRGRALRVLGRASSVVKILGELVDVAQVERRFLAMSGFAAHAAVVAVDDPRKGQTLVLVCEPPVESDAARRAVADFNATVPGFERIGAVIAAPAIPRAALGKVAREALRALISPAPEGHR